MLRFINTLILGLLLLVLVGLALANRDIVTLEAIPSSLAGWIGVDWTIRLPLFLVILLAVLLGLVIGLVWEWLRESAQRAEHSRTQHQLNRTQQELCDLKSEAAPQRSRDDILALLDDGK